MHTPKAMPLGCFYHNAENSCNFQDLWYNIQKCVASFATENEEEF